MTVDDGGVIKSRRGGEDVDLNNIYRYMDKLYFDTSRTDVLPDLGYSANQKRRPETPATFSHIIVPNDVSHQIIKTQ